MNSDKGFFQPDGETLSTGGGQIIENYSPTEEHIVSDVSVDLTDGHFFANLSWSQAVDYLNSKPLSC